MGKQGNSQVSKWAKLVCKQTGASGQMGKCKVVNYARSRVINGSGKWASVKCRVGNMTCGQVGKQKTCQTGKGPVGKGNRGSKQICDCKVVR